MSLWERVEERAAASPTALFAVDEADRRLDFAGLRDAALVCAAGLAARGVRANTAVSWVLPTRLDALVLVAALARLGVRQNPILPVYREREVSFIARQSEARFLVVPGEWRGFDYAAMARRVATERPGLEVLDVAGGLPEGDPGRLPPHRPAGDDPVRWLFYTSGTTADPKGALHGDASLEAASAGMCEALALAADDRVAMVFPVTHVGGIVWLFSALRTGCALICIEAFDAKQSPEVLARHGVTQATAGTVFHQAYLAAQRARGAEDGPLFPAVRAFPGGGAPKPPDLHFAVKRELGGAGIVSGWGMTECPIATMNRVGDDDARLAHGEGAPTPGMEVRALDPDGRPVARGEEGELVVRGPQVCRGYLDAALDREAFDAEGWLRTGDLGRIDAAGHVAITGRAKDVIIRKGENVSAKEIEDALHRHPAVAEVAVVGLPDPEAGERCCAVVARRDAGAPLTLEDLTGPLREAGLAPYKLPERLELVGALPRNATGKVLKRELRARYSESPQAPRAPRAPR